VLPESSPAGGKAAALEVERLSALGYVSGRSAVTTMARVNLGEILFRRGATREAIHELEASIAADPGNQRAGLWLARAYASAGRTDDAVRLYDRLITGATSSLPVDPLAVLAVTDLDIARGQQAAAAARLARLPAAVSRRPEGELARGALAVAGGRNAEAERLFRKVYAEVPTNVEALSRLVDLLMVTDRRAAAQLAGEAARRFPGSPERQALVGETALAERRGADAVQAFTRALALAPDAESLRIELGRAELMQNHADAALEAIGSLASRDAEVVRGAAQSEKGNWPAAVQAYARAAADGRPSPELLNALGNAQLEAGNAADAVATLERSLALKADQPAIRSLADRARAQAGKRP
jgi:predicted Zn-dependent protease